MHYTIDTSQEQRRRGLEGWLLFGVYAAVGIVVIGVVLLCGMFGVFSLPILTKGSFFKVFSFSWAPDRGSFGILSMVIGTIVLATSSLILGWILAVGVVTWLLCFSKGWWGKYIRFCVSTMTAIPTVIYGLTAVFLIVPLVRNFFGGSGFSFFSACITLAILITPTMVLVMESGLSPRVEALCPEALAIGFSRLDLVRYFVVPHSYSTFITAALIGFGRATGDTMIALMLSGNAPYPPEHSTDSMRTLTAHIALIGSSEVGGVAYDALFLAGSMLLAMNITMSLIVRNLGAKS